MKKYTVEGGWTIRKITYWNLYDKNEKYIATYRTLQEAKQAAANCENFNKRIIK